MLSAGNVNLAESQCCCTYEHSLTQLCYTLSGHSYPSGTLVLFFEACHDLPSKIPACHTLLFPADTDIIRRECAAWYAGVIQNPGRELVANYAFFPDSGVIGHRF